MHRTACYSQQDFEATNKTLRPMPRTTSQSSSCDHEKGVACDLCIQHGPGDICGGYCERTVANSWRKLSQYERPWCGACASQLERDMTTRQNLITHIPRQMYVCPSEFDVCALTHMLRFSEQVFAALKLEPRRLTSTEIKAK